MPELNKLLEFVELLRIGATLRTPAELGRIAAHAANDFRTDDVAIRAMVASLTEVVRGQYGDDGVAKFNAAYWRIAKR